MADNSSSDEAGMTALLQNAPRLKPSPDLWLRIASNAALTPVLAPVPTPAQSAPIGTGKHTSDATHAIPRALDSVQEKVWHEAPWYERGLALAASLAFAAAMVTLPWLTSSPEPQSSSALAPASDTATALPFDEDTADETLAWLAGLGDFSQITAVQAGTPVDSNDFADLNDLAPEIRTYANLGNLGLNTLVYAQE